MSLKFFLEYFLIKLLLLICSLFSKKFIFNIFKYLGTLSFYLLKKRRNLAIRNITNAFPKKDKKNIIKIAKGSFQNFSEVIAYNLLVQCNKINKKNINEFVLEENFNILESLIKNSSNGVLIITGHIGNWECLSQYVSLKISTKFHAIARQMNNPLIDKNIVNVIRSKFNIHTFHKKNAILRLMKVLKKGDTAGILIDQNLDDKMHIKTKFFGNFANSTPLPAILKIKYNIPIIFAFMVKNSAHKYELIFYDDITLNFNNKSENELIFEITNNHQKILEEVIKEYPEQWLWMHNRWKL